MGKLGSIKDKSPNDVAKIFHFTRFDFTPCGMNNYPTKHSKVVHQMPGFRLNYWQSRSTFSQMLHVLHTEMTKYFLHLLRTFLKQ